eukprot:GHVS01055578.1.p1 GENE.GHVS01055578.1~~GHVS01055578.1.p1  ORF type:complete len:242 (+),score=45.37 GHVS01055578.1:543-1268(+)
MPRCMNPLAIPRQRFYCQKKQKTLRSYTDRWWTIQRNNFCIYKSPFPTIKDSCKEYSLIGARLILQVALADLALYRSRWSHTIPLIVDGHLRYESSQGRVVMFPADRTGDGRETRPFILYFSDYRRAEDWHEQLLALQFVNNKECLQRLRTWFGLIRRSALCCALSAVLKESRRRRERFQLMRLYTHTLQGQTAKQLLSRWKEATLATTTASLRQPPTATPPTPLPPSSFATTHNMHNNNS